MSDKELNRSTQWQLNKEQEYQLKNLYEDFMEETRPVREHPSYGLNGTARYVKDIFEILLDLKDE